MTQITFGYSDSEDRVWLSTEGARYWLTRRLLAGLLPAVCDLMQKTVPGGEIPNALPNEKRIALEHQESMQANPDGKPALEQNAVTRPEGAAPAKPPILANSVTFQADSQRCVLIVKTSREETKIQLGRIDFHRLLAALKQVVTSARWGLTGLPDWLND
jgi:hypothetical protein